MYVSIFLLDNIVKKAGYIMNKRRYLIAEGQSEYTYDELGEISKEQAVNEVAEILNEMNAEDLVTMDLNAITVDLKKAGIPDENFEVHMGEDNPFDFSVDIKDFVLDSTNPLFMKAVNEAGIDLTEFISFDNERTHNSFETKEQSKHLDESNALDCFEKDGVKFKISGLVQDYKTNIKVSDVTEYQDEKIHTYNLRELVEQLSEGLASVLDEIVLHYVESSDQELMDMDSEGYEQAQQEVNDYKFDVNGHIIY